MDPTPWVEKAKSGNAEAYGRLVEMYQDYVFSICMIYLRQQDLAEDAAQQVFLAAFQSVRKLQETNRFQAWLKRMTINRCLDELRRRRRYLVSSIDELDEKALLQAAQSNAPEDAVSVDQEIMAYTGLFLLKSRERKILTWHHLYGLNVSSIAHMLGISVAAAKKRLERARKTLREEMTKMDARHAIGKGFSKKIVELINRPDLVSTPGNPIFDIWSEIKKLLPDFQVVEGDEVIERSQNAEFFNVAGFNRIDLDKDRALRTETTSAVLDYLKVHANEPCRIITAGRVWRDDEEDELHLKMFHQLDLCIMSPDVREGDIVALATGLIEKLLSGKAIRWELRDLDLVKRCWVLLVENSGQYTEIIAGGEYRGEVIQGCGIDASRFTAAGFGLGLERLAMIRYGIHDVRAIQSPK